MVHFQDTIDPSAVVAKSSAFWEEKKRLVTRCPAGTRRMWVSSLWTFQTKTESPIEYASTSLRIPQ
jgi:hypothetical protein